MQSSDSLPSARGPVRGGNTPDRVQRARRKLRRAGVAAAVQAGPAGYRVAPAGAGLSELLQAGSRADMALNLGLPLVLHVDRELDEDGIDAALGQLANRPCYRRSVISVDSSHRLGAELTGTLARFLPGTSLYRFVDPDGPHPQAVEPCAVTAWHAGVRSRCPLLPAERTHTLLPGVAAAVPAESAWLPLTLDLGRLADSKGRIARAVLDTALDAAIEAGDTLIDALAWLSPTEADDAQRNRRMAIQLTGIGELVARAGRDPSSLATLRHMDRLVARVHDGLWQRSARLAGTRGLLPALSEREPSACWSDDRHRHDWSVRWRSAVRRLKVRHRNLLLMTPDALWPYCAAATPAYIDLIPLLAYADVLGFGRRRLPHFWSRADRLYFHARLRAQVEALNATSLIAIGA